MTHRGKNFTLLSRRPGVSDAEDAAPVDEFSQIRRPKLKFNFTVEINFRGTIGEALSPNATTVAAEIANNERMTFAIKQASRPNPTVNYTDVNFYNYRTKVATKVDYGSMQLTFYDDVGNVAHAMYEAYLKGISPIANLDRTNADTIFSSKEGLRNGAFNSLDNAVEGVVESGTGSLGPLPMNAAGGESGLIKSIIVRHWFYSQIESREGRTDASQSSDPNAFFSENIQYVDYEFINPKIINMTLDELDMAQSDVNTLMMNFIYDSVYINPPSDSSKGETVPLLEKSSSKVNTASEEATERDNALTRLVNKLPTGLRGELNAITHLDEGFTLNDVRNNIRNGERLYNRIRRIDTIPDIDAVDVLSDVIGPLNQVSSNDIASDDNPRPETDDDGILEVLGGLITF